MCFLIARVPIPFCYSYSVLDIPLLLCFVNGDFLSICFVSRISSLSYFLSFQSLFCDSVLFIDCFLYFSLNSVLLCAYCMYIYNIGFMIPSMMECHTPNCYDLILAVIMKPSTILNLLLMFFQKAPSDFYLSLYCFFHCLCSFSIKYSA
jgi:hypothetical protein